MRSVHRVGLEFAVSEINSNGGNGRETNLVVEDTASEAGGHTIFRRMIEQDSAVAITGPVSSDVGIRTARTAEELQVPLLCHMSGADEVLTTDSRHTFRVGLLPASTTMKAQAQLISDAGYERTGAIVGDYACHSARNDGISVARFDCRTPRETMTESMRYHPKQISTVLSRNWDVAGKPNELRTVELLSLSL